MEVFVGHCQLFYEVHDSRGTQKEGRRSKEQATFRRSLNQSEGFQSPLNHVMRDVARGEKAVAAGLKVGRGLGGWELAQLN